MIAKGVLHFKYEISALRRRAAGAGHGETSGVVRMKESKIMIALKEERLGRAERRDDALPARLDKLLSLSETVRLSTLKSAALSALHRSLALPRNRAPAFCFAFTSPV